MSFSQRLVSCTMQVLQSGLLHRRFLLSILPHRSRAWTTEGSMRMVRQGQLQVWPQMRPCTHLTGTEYVNGQEKQEGCSGGSECGKSRCVRERWPPARSLAAQHGSGPATCSSKFPKPASAWIHGSHALPFLLKAPHSYAAQSDLIAFYSRTSSSRCRFCFLWASRRK